MRVKVGPAVRAHKESSDGEGVRTADLGPNEVTQKVLGDLPNANKFDQAAPGMWTANVAHGVPCSIWVAFKSSAVAGRAGTVGKKAGQSVGNAAKDSVASAKSKAGPPLLP